MQTNTFSDRVIDFNKGQVKMNNNIFQWEEYAWYVRIESKISYDLWITFLNNNFD